MPPPTSTEVICDDSQFIPSLREAIGDAPLDRKRLWKLAMKVVDTEDTYEDDMEDRRDVVITDGVSTVNWRAESLSSLFRGTARAPSLEKYPDEYVPLFATIEEQVLIYADIFDEPTDDEMKGVYSNLARMPDGTGRTLLQNHMWQACALALGTRPLEWNAARSSAETVAAFLPHFSHPRRLEKLSAIPAPGIGLTPPALPTPPSAPLPSPARLDGCRR